MLEWPSRLWRIAATGFCFSVFGRGGLIMRCVVYPLLLLFVQGAQRREAVTKALIHYLFRCFVALMRWVGVLTVNRPLTAVLADEVFGFLVVGQQAGQQFFGYVVFLGGHGAYGQAGLRRRWIGRLHKILHTLSYRYNHLMWGRSTFLTGYQEVSPFFESITTLWNFLSNVIDSFHAFERMVECNL